MFANNFLQWIVSLKIFFHWIGLPGSPGDDGKDGNSGFPGERGNQGFPGLPGLIGMEHFHFYYMFIIYDIHTKIINKIIRYCVSIKITLKSEIICLITNNINYFIFYIHIDAELYFL